MMWLHRMHIDTKNTARIGVPAVFFYVVMRWSGGLFRESPLWG